MQRRSPERPSSLLRSLPPPRRTRETARGFMRLRVPPYPVFSLRGLFTEILRIASRGISSVPALRICPRQFDDYSPSQLFPSAAHPRPPLSRLSSSRRTFANLVSGVLFFSFFFVYLFYSNSIKNCIGANLNAAKERAGEEFNH